MNPGIGLGGAPPQFQQMLQGAQQMAGQRFGQMQQGPQQMQPPMQAPMQQGYGQQMPPQMMQQPMMQGAGAIPQGYAEGGSVDPMRSSERYRTLKAFERLIQEQRDNGGLGFGPGSRAANQKLRELEDAREAFARQNYSDAEGSYAPFPGAPSYGYRNGQSLGDDPGYAQGGQVLPEAKSLAKLGIGGDTELAHFSRDELEMLDSIRGGADINPHTGLPQYGWLGSVLKGLVRAGAAIAGGVIAGPLGAAAGSGLATKLTGGSWSDALKGAALSGVGGELVQGIGGGGWNPTSAWGQGATAAPGAVAAETPGMALPNGIEAAKGLPGAISATPGAITPAGIGTQFLNAARSMPGLAAGMGALSTPLESGAAAPALSGAGGPSFGVRPMQRKAVPYEGDLKQYGQGPGHKWYDTVNPAPQYTAPIPGLVDYSDMVPGYAAGGIAAPTVNALYPVACNASRKTESAASRDTANPPE